MNYEEEYKEAFKRAERRFDPNPADGYAGYANGIIEDIFPQFIKREDERTRKEILDFIKSFWADHKESIPRISSWLAWLEKQKEQKEPHYTKRNALFDECVKNCDPEIMKRVSDEVDAMLEKEQKPDEPVTDCHDLTEEIERTYHDGSVADTDDMDHVDYENIARHFAAWMKTKMMEGAVEGSCLDDLTAGSVIDTEYGVLYLPPDKFCVGDKVKIIIVKEEE